VPDQFRHAVKKMDARNHSSPDASPDSAETGKPRRAADLAYETLRDLVIGASLPGGARLTESQLAEQLGLSRTPVREAIRRLISEGLLRRAPGEGLRVVGFSAEEIDQIFHIRLMLETYAARRAAVHATADELAAMQALLATMETCTPPQTDSAMRRLSDANAEFHRRIVKAARVPRLAGVLSGVVDAALVMRTYRRYSERDLIRSLQHHRELVEAIAARAPDWAASVMAAHLQAAASVAAAVGPLPRPAASR